MRDASMPAAKETYDKLVKIAEGAALLPKDAFDSCGFNADEQAMTGTVRERHAACELRHRLDEHDAELLLHGSRRDAR